MVFCVRMFVRFADHADDGLVGGLVLFVDVHDTKKRRVLRQLSAFFLQMLTMQTAYSDDNSHVFIFYLKSCHISRIRQI